MPPRPRVDAPAAPASPDAWHTHPAARHVAAFVLAFVLPLPLRWIGVSASASTSFLDLLAITLGITALVGGLVLYLWWIVTAWRHRDRDVWMTPWMFGQGPTAFSRHPGWLAVLLLVLAQALISGGWALWIYFALLALALDAWMRLQEEPAWMAAHYDEYVAYRDRVARWLPWSAIGRSLRDLGSLLRNSAR